jgi:hypothetical protein
MKLNNDMRGLVVEKIVDHTFEKKQKELTETQTKLFWKIYDSLFKTVEEKEFFESLPKEWFQKNNFFSLVTKSGWANYICINENCWMYSNNVPLPEFATSKMKIENQELNDEVEKFWMDQQKAKEERKQFHNKIFHLMRSFSTEKQFKDSAPELYDLVKDMNFFKKVVDTKAVVVVEQELLCDMAKYRNEFRAGCSV